jgi:rhamnose utilization protein RhaD (predicted bifunctional aldolase and dehydrogenase)
MKSRWSDAEARGSSRAMSRQRRGEDLALRVYTTRLLGGDPRLVLHGGGNTSVKTHMKDLSATRSK